MFWSVQPHIFEENRSCLRGLLLKLSPSIGWDFGGDGARTMILVYDLPQIDTIYRRFAGVNGSAYLVGGVGMTVLAHTNTGQKPMYLVPIRTGIGARLGINIGYLKFSERATWNPF